MNRGRRDRAGKGAYPGSRSAAGEVVEFPRRPTNFLEPCTARVVNIFRIKPMNIASIESVKNSLHLLIFESIVHGGLPLVTEVPKSGIKAVWARCVLRASGAMQHAADFRGSVRGEEPSSLQLS